MQNDRDTHSADGAGMGTKDHAALAQGKGGGGACQRPQRGIGQLAIAGTSDLQPRKARSWPTALLATCAVAAVVANVEVADPNEGPSRAYLNQGCSVAEPDPIVVAAFINHNARRKHSCTFTTSSASCLHAHDMHAL